jgi:plasmid stability protein
MSVLKRAGRSTVPSFSRTIESLTEARDCSDIKIPSTRHVRVQVASIVVRRLSDATKEQLRQRAVRHKRSLEAEVRAILERAAQEAPGPSDPTERFPDWFIRMTRPGIDLDAAIEENRLPHEGVKL